MKSPRLKPGQRVLCVEGFLTEFPVKGQHYTVTAVNRSGEFVALAEAPIPDAVGWYSWRFEVPSRPGPVAPKDRSRVDAGPSWGLGSGGQS